MLGTCVATYRKVSNLMLKAVLFLVPTLESLYGQDAVLNSRQALDKLKAAD